ncbi:MAG: hypothetical protein NTZ72_14150, partial [Afipia sp.]|nr:hypothetical protein [Afipia sp.]
LVSPAEFESRFEAIIFINALGNCSLLDKSFNISKSDYPMWDFLKEVHEFKQGKIERGDWEAALSLNETLTEPNKSSLADITKAIRARDSIIRKDLADFIAGTKQRVD